MTDKTIAALIVYAAAGDAEGARRHLGFTLARGSDLQPIRRKLEGHCTSDFYRAVLSALPWLADDSFTVPRPGGAAVPDAEPVGILERLRAAGTAGLPAKEIELRDTAIIGEAVALFDEPTGGRPRKMIRLREFDPRYNPFAQA